MVEEIGIFGAAKAEIGLLGPRSEPRGAQNCGGHVYLGQGKTARLHGHSRITLPPHARPLVAFDSVE
jgi:hypothetical protein